LTFILNFIVRKTAGRGKRKGKEGKGNVTERREKTKISPSLLFSSK
jgi:hypothetical protein